VIRKQLKPLLLASSIALALGVQAAAALEISNADELAAALAEGNSQITLRKGSEIVIDETLVFDGAGALRINGNGSTISADSDFHGTLLQVIGADEVSVKDLTLAGPGGYDINQQLSDKSAGKGLEIVLDPAATGMVGVTLNSLKVQDVGNHGIYVRDCTSDDCGNGNSGDGDGSDASIMLRLNGVFVDGVGFGKQDGDGVRVDERGAGSVILSATNSEFLNAGGDGIELDEAGAGDVEFNVRNVSFVDNGAYCSEDFNGLTLEGIFERDPSCNDDGEADVDDAFDIDEADDGWMRGSVNNVSIVGSYDEGLDFDTEGEGGADIDIVNLDEHDNVGDVVKVSEEGAGSVAVRIANIDVESEVQLEEEDGGDISVSVTNAYIGDDLKITETGAGDAEAVIQSTETKKNIEGEEDDAGQLRFRITNSLVGKDLELIANGDQTGAVSFKNSEVVRDRNLENVDAL